MKSTSKYKSSRGWLMQRMRPAHAPTALGRRADGERLQACEQPRVHVDAWREPRDVVALGAVDRAERAVQQRVREGGGVRVAAAVLPRQLAPRCGHATRPRGDLIYQAPIAHPPKTPRCADRSTGGCLAVSVYGLARVT